MSEVMDEIIQPISVFASNMVRLINNEINEKIPQAIQHFFAQPPPWFVESERKLNEKIERLEAGTNERFDRLEARFDRLEAGTNERFDVLEENMNERFDRSEARIDSTQNEMTRYFNDLDIRSEYRFAKMNNVQCSTIGSTPSKVPFLNREVSEEGLPPITTVEDIDRLSRQQCETYLRGYNIPFRSNETIRLKEKLRDAIGLVKINDITYSFRTFT